ncbi:Peptidoglycan D,D-transpeptidase MrdA [Sinobacterium norvegicum]|uniref:Peptidoglycan D,D-transpeptidase MrdA n=1 Tax=Sinobacterium norvegicum TaxID=1641715 RepID=A0ABM9AGU5_9GAMM|nr:penicillin-binding protein 2 [Sinobacterium norvegicum]CAH0992433.1 Peptidoglycan D,D-transpeptidase MrdA [Sinobacterium norvegicum]
MSSRDHIKDVIGERRLYASRIIVAVLFVIVACVIIGYRYYSLQITEHQKYSTQSDRNRVHVQSIPPNRGLIYDRHGKLLAKNRTIYNLAITRERVSDLDATVERLRLLLDLTDEEVERFNRRVKQTRAFDQVPLRFQLNEEEIATLAVNRYQLAGVEVVGSLSRYYPEPELYAHAIGYVGRINEREMERIDRENYAGTDSIGKTGIERFYEDELHGIVGYRNVETNVRGRVLRVIDQVDPVPGDDLTLFIDDKVQRAAYEALGEERGSIVAIDPETGGVIAIVSTPSYDINMFVNGISTKHYNALRSDLDLPLFNRSLQGQYPPGSTLKPVIGLAGLEYGTVTPTTTINDPGWFSLPNDEHRYRDWKRGGHGHKVDFKMAMEQSCDVYYYDLAHRLGIDNMAVFAKQFGLGDYTGIDLPSERKGLVPSREWKRNYRQTVWYPGETLIAGIGQGYMLTTPLQLALSTAIIANKGNQLVPRVVDSGRRDASHREDISLNNPNNWDVVFDSMKAVVYGTRGTGRRLREAPYVVAGKSGTAQVIGIAQDARYDSEQIEKRKRDHALFIAFAPIENPKIAVAVVVENGEGGGSVAGPMALAVMNAYLLNEQGEVRGDL